VVLPGPSFIFLIPGLMILSLEYPQAKKWLRVAQKNDEEIRTVAR
jgi:hypothetical protein